MNRLAVLVAVAVVLLLPLRADAGLLELTGQVQTGGQGGLGLFGAQKDNSFHGQRANFQYGALVGVEFLFTDVWVEHNQFYGGGVDGTWTQFMLGFDIDFGIGDERLSGKGRGKGKPRVFGELGTGIGYGVGTSAQVDLPLDRSELTDQGFIAQGHVSFGYRLNNVISFGLHVPMQFGYVIKTSKGLDELGDTGDAAANNEDNHYGMLHGAVLLTTRFNFAFQ